DGARTSTIPSYNPRIDSLFNLRTDHAPHVWGVSPRVGFVLGQGDIILPRGERINRVSRRFITREGFEGAEFPLALHGGIGAFRGVPSVAQIATIAQATGLSSAVRQLACVGSAAPIPDWSAYGANRESIPSA